MGINCEDSERKCVPGTGPEPHDRDLLFFLESQNETTQAEPPFSLTSSEPNWWSLKAFPGQRKPVILSQKDRSHQASKCPETSKQDHGEKCSRSADTCHTNFQRQLGDFSCVLWASLRPVLKARGRVVPFCLFLIPSALSLLPEPWYSPPRCPQPTPAHRTQGLFFWENWAKLSSLSF